MKELNDFLCFGKYKGKSIKDVAGYDPQYIIWIADNTNQVLPQDIIEQCRQNNQSYEDEKECDMYWGIDGW